MKYPVYTSSKHACNRKFHLFCHISVTGNTDLYKLSDNTFRKLGLCEDHFSDTSFTNATKVRLIRDAIPIAYNNAESLVNEKNIEVKERHTIVLPPNNGNMIEEQVPEECTLPTYRPAILNFEMSAEEEDVMEWIHLEPPIHQNVKNKDNSKSEIYNNKKNNPKTIIRALRIENLNLRQKIKRLKYQLRCMAQNCKKSNKKNRKKKC